MLHDHDACGGYGSAIEDAKVTPTQLCELLGVRVRPRVLMDLGFFVRRRRRRGRRSCAGCAEESRGKLVPEAELLRLLRYRSSGGCKGRARLDVAGIGSPVRGNHRRNGRTLAAEFLDLLFERRDLLIVENAENSHVIVTDHLFRELALDLVLLGLIGVKDTKGEAVGKRHDGTQAGFVGGTSLFFLAALLFGDDALSVAFVLLAENNGHASEVLLVDVVKFGAVGKGDDGGVLAERDGVLTGQVHMGLFGDHPAAVVELEDVLVGYKVVTNLHGDVCEMGKDVDDLGVDRIRRLFRRGGVALDNTGVFEIGVVRQRNLYKILIILVPVITQRHSFAEPSMGEDLSHLLPEAVVDVSMHVQPLVFFVERSLGDETDFVLGGSTVFPSEPWLELGLCGVKSRHQHLHIVRGEFGTFLVFFGDDTGDCGAGVHPGFETIQGLRVIAE